MLTKNKSLNFNILSKNWSKLWMKTKKLIILVEIHYLLIFLRDIHKKHLSIEKAGNKQNNFANEWKNFDKGTNCLGKQSLIVLYNLDYYLLLERMFFITLEAGYFQ